MLSTSLTTHTSPVLTHMAQTGGNRGHRRSADRIPVPDVHLNAQRREKAVGHCTVFHKIALSSAAVVRAAALVAALLPVAQIAVAPVTLSAQGSGGATGSVPSEAEVEPWFDAVCALWDDAAQYRLVAQRAEALGRARHSEAASRQRHVDYFTSLKPGSTPFEGVNGRAARTTS